jgi:hypothetical protein
MHNMDVGLSSTRSRVANSPRRSHNSSDVDKVELTFSSGPTLPMLELPKGNVESCNTKYDYSVAVDKPFAFDTHSDEECAFLRHRHRHQHARCVRYHDCCSPPLCSLCRAVTNFQVNVEPDDFLNSIPEPDTGIFPEEFDREVRFSAAELCIDCINATRILTDCDACSLVPIVCTEIREGGRQHQLLHLRPVCVHVAHRPSSPAEPGTSSAATTEAYANGLFLLI